MKPVQRLSAFVMFLVLFFNIACNKDLSCENCLGGNIPPVAKAGLDRVASPKDSVTLDGSASSDSDGNIAVYKWNKISGPSSGEIRKANSTIAFVKSLKIGVYKFELVVVDNGGLSARDTVQVIVNDPVVNQRPMANAGNDQNIIGQIDSVLLDGSNSFDSDGSIAAYKWAMIAGASPVTILTPHSVKTFIKTMVRGIYKFELSVKDNGGLTAVDTMTVTIENPAVNQPPVCAGIDQIIVLPTNLTNLNGGCIMDPEHNIIGYAWTKIAGSPPCNIVTPGAVQTQVTDLVKGIYKFELKVTDVRGLFSKDTVQVTVVL